jgi:hypothetical protein
MEGIFTTPRMTGVATLTNAAPRRNFVFLILSYRPLRFDPVTRSALPRTRRDIATERVLDFSVPM